MVCRRNMFKQQEPIKMLRRYELIGSIQINKTIIDDNTKNRTHGTRFWAWLWLMVLSSLDSRVASCLAAMIQ